MAKKTPSEKETRAKLLYQARKYGAEAELLKLFSNYDEWVKNAKTDDERRAIAALGVADINKFFTGTSNTEKDYFLIDKKTGKKLE
jgi:hypothetical protein